MVGSLVFTIAAALLLAIELYRHLRYDIEGLYYRARRRLRRPSR